jgi:hypothetical protein
MRHWLGVGVACLIVLGGVVLCSGPGAEQVRAVPRATGDCTHYVDNQVSTDGNGSLGMPWDDIAGHVNELAPGDVLCVRGDPSTPGRAYTGPPIVLDANAGTPSGAENAPIIVRTYPGEHVVLRAAGANILEFIGVTYWQFDGFAFDKQSYDGYAIHFRWADFNVVRNCDIYNGTGEGIHFTYGRCNVIENCKIHGFEAQPYKDAHCILVAGGRDNMIRNNEIYDCTGDGIHFYPYHTVSRNFIEHNHFYTTLGPCSENAIDVKCGSPIILGNVMHGYRPNDGSCGGSGGTVGEAIIIHKEAYNVLIDGNEIYDSGSGIIVYHAEDLRIINNVIHDIVTDPSTWTNIGIYVNGVTSASIVNNTLADIPRDALRIGEGPILTLNVRNNLFYRTGRSYRKDGGSTWAFDYNGWFNAAERIVGQHDIVGSIPQFIALGDYHLRAISQAVDVGDNASSTDYDSDGNPRPYGPGIDLGAFEVQEPRPVTNLRVSEGVTTTGSVTVTLVWNVPGQVGQPGTAHHYELRHDDQRITEERWDQAPVANAYIAAGQSGEREQTTVSVPWDGSGHVYFALRVFDAEDRRSEVSNPGFWPFESVFLPLVSRW